MLVLSRRKDETIKIGDEISITVVEIKGDTVRLGITAPRAISVHRKEIYDAIQAENITISQRQPPTPQALDGLRALLKSKTEDASLAALLKNRVADKSE